MNGVVGNNRNHSMNGELYTNSPVAECFCRSKNVSKHRYFSESFPVAALTTTSVGNTLFYYVNPDISNLYVSDLAYYSLVNGSCKSSGH